MTTPRAPRVTLDVTKELIEDAIPRDSSHCMFAEAVKAGYPGASHVSVDLQTIRFTDKKKGLRYTYLTPRIAQIALINFDQGEKPGPMTCTLRGGQVSTAGRTPKPTDTAADTARRENIDKKHRTTKQQAATAKASKASRARLSDGAHERNGGRIPDKIGGRTPPTTSFARRRTFGLRDLVR